jgi:hypothetical protein
LRVLIFSAEFMLTSFAFYNILNKFGNFKYFFIFVF